MELWNCDKPIKTAVVLCVNMNNYIYSFVICINHTYSWCLVGLVVVLCVIMHDCRISVTSQTRHVCKRAFSANPVDKTSVDVWLSWGSIFSSGIQVCDKCEDLSGMDLGWWIEIIWEIYSAINTNTEFKYHTCQNKFTRTNHCMYKTII